MFERKLAVIYFHAAESEPIVNSDYQRFYVDFLNKIMAFDEANIEVSHAFCPNPSSLFDTIEKLLNSSAQEIFLHFSGHGNADGIPYPNWQIDNEDFGVILDNEKIKSCFFSSCRSADLVKILKNRKIPVVIGTKDDVENNFAIEFQRKFYKYLSNRKSFIQAFETSITKLKQENQQQIVPTQILRSGIALDDIDENNLNEFIIAFQDETEEDRHLIYPTVLDEIGKVEDYKRKLFVYSPDESAIERFEKEFHKNEKAYYSLVKLFPLKEEDLGVLNKKEERIESEDIKILLLANSVDPLGSNARRFYNNSDLLDKGNLQFALALQQDLSRSTVLQNLDLFEQKVENNIRFRSIEELFSEEKFDQFVIGTEVRFNNRMKVIQKFPVEPTREEVNNQYQASEFIRLIFAPKKYERLINYFVNIFHQKWKRIDSKPFTPIVIADQIHQKELPVIKILFNSIKNNYKDHQLVRFALNQGEKIIFQNLFLLGQIFILRIDIKNEQDLKSELEKVIAVFENIELPNPPEYPSYMFILNGNSHSPFNQNELSVTNAKSLTEPRPLTNEGFKEWLANEEDNYDGLNELTQELYQIDMDEFQERCPSDLIEILCEALGISSNTLLKIS